MCGEGEGETEARDGNEAAKTVATATKAAREVAQREAGPKDGKATVALAS